MSRRDLVLMVLAAAGGQSLTPVQIQKSMFLVSDNLAHLVREGQPFNFAPYDYGPFDRAVYDEANELQAIGLAEVALDRSGRWHTYRATPKGVASGEALLGQLNDDDRTYIERVVEWVREQNFASLVKSIYEAYPEMKANSIFQY